MFDASRVCGWVTSIKTSKVVSFFRLYLPYFLCPSRIHRNIKNNYTLQYVSRSKLNEKNAMFSLFTFNSYE